MRYAETVRSGIKSASHAKESLLGSLFKKDDDAPHHHIRESLMHRADSAKHALASARHRAMERAAPLVKRAAPLALGAAPILKRAGRLTDTSKADWPKSSRAPRREHEKHDKREGPGVATQVLTAAAATAIGAGLMYFLDPARGRRRRSLLRDRAVHAWHTTEAGLRKSARDAACRAQGLAHDTRARFRSETVGDEQLIARVRSAMGRAVSHPGSIHVDARDGDVVLSGLILGHEVDRLLARVRSVRGVKTVENHLDIHADGSGIPGLQGGRQPSTMRTGGWSPTTRIAVGLTGGALVSGAIARRDPIALGLGVLGAALVLRSTTNVSTRRLVGIGRGRRPIDVQKTIHIEAPVDRVFEFWTRYENFPHFMSRVREVREVGGDRSHWVVAGPAGVSVEWDAEITRYEPGRCIAWHSVEGSPIRNAGAITFEENDAGGTRVNVQLSYSPPGGALGHLAAVLFGADPKSDMDQDLMRMKVMIETGNPPHDAAQPVERREDAMPQMNVGPTQIPEPRGTPGS